MLVKAAVKGMRDLLPEETKLKEYIISAIRRAYSLHGFCEIESPSVEDIKNLTGKDGGENEKLIYRILKRGEKLKAADSEAELCDLGLRYDLTVPLCRYYANNIGSLPSVFKVIQIGNVWRADRPQKGRLRQFTQCDVDIIGEESYLAEVDLICATSSALKSLSFNDFTVIISDRRLLLLLIEKAGIPSTLYDEAVIILDKFEKIGRDEVIGELVEKGVDPCAANNLMERVVEIDGALSPLDKCKEIFGAEGKEIFDSLSKIIDTVRRGKDINIRLDITLARGMNYYTGTIFEIKVDGYRFSVCGGGRYDKMIGKFTGNDQPACGFSLGFESIFTILSERGFSINENVSGVAFIIDKEAGQDTVAEIFRRADELRLSGKKCTVVKRIKNTALLVKQLKAQGYNEIFAVGEGTSIRPFN